MVSDPGEKTEVVYDQNEIIQRAVNTYYDLKYSCNVCADSIGPSMFVIPNHPVTKGYQDMKRRGIRIRFISEITKDNISSCKELMTAETVGIVFYNYSILLSVPLALFAGAFTVVVPEAYRRVKSVNPTKSKIGLSKV